MNLQARKVILVFILIIFLVVILLFIQLMWFADYSEGQPPPLSFTRAYIETQNRIVETLIHQTETASAEGFGYGIPEGRTMTPITPMVTPTQP